MPLNFLLCLPSMPLGWRQLSLTAIFLSDWYLLNLRPNFCVGLEEVEKRKGLELGTRTKLSCARVGRERAAARSPSRGRRTTRRGVRGSRTQRAVGVGEAAPRSEQHQRAAALFSGTDTSPTTIARARARYGLRSTRSTYLNNLGLRDWLDHGDSLSIWLSPSPLRLAYALCALLSLPALDPLWAAAAAPGGQCGRKTGNLQGGMHRGTDMGISTQTFWEKREKVSSDIFPERIFRRGSAGGPETR